MTTKAKNTAAMSALLEVPTPALIDIDKLKILESYRRSYFGETTTHLNMSEPVSLTQELGMTWPAEAVEAVDIAAGAIAALTESLGSTRPPITWELITAPDFANNLRLYAIDDNIQTLNVKRLKGEVVMAAYSRTARTIMDATPDLIGHLADLAIERREDRELAPMVATLPKRLRDRVSQWGVIVTAHDKLLRISDYSQYATLERNSHIHALHKWTHDQWLELHTEKDTLDYDGKGVDWFKWAIEHDIEINPVRSVTELATRTKQANDLGAAHNRKHRPRRSY